MQTMVTIKSSNRKTGPLAVTTRTQDTCPTSCPLMGNGCYATGRIFGIAKKYGAEGAEIPVAEIRRGDRVAEIRRGDLVAVARLAETLPEGRGLRLNVAGDFVLADGSPDMEYIEACNFVAETRPDVEIIAYTHAWRTLDRSMFSYNVNASCDTDADIAEARAAGWGTVTVGATHGDTIADTRVVRCPAETRDDTTCASCMLCAKLGDLNTTVTFTPHGAGKRKAQSVADRRK